MFILSLHYRFIPVLILLLLYIGRDQARDTRCDEPRRGLGGSCNWVKDNRFNSMIAKEIDLLFIYLL